MPGAQKTDWNDILKTKGLEALQQSLGLPALQREWGALKNLKDARVDAYLSADNNLRTASGAQEKERLSTVRNKTVSQLLQHPDLSSLEKIAPRALKELRQRFYSQQLSPLQRNILQSPAWDQMLHGKGRQFEAHVDLLARTKKQIFETLHDTAKVKRLMKPVTSLLEKIMTSKIQRTELQKVAPDFYQQLQTHLRDLSHTYHREREMELERER